MSPKLPTSPHPVAPMPPTTDIPLPPLTSDPPNVPPPLQLSPTSTRGTATGNSTTSSCGWSRGTPNRCSGIGWAAEGGARMATGVPPRPRRPRPSRGTGGTPRSSSSRWGRGRGRWRRPWRCWGRLGGWRPSPSSAGAAGPPSASCAASAPSCPASRPRPAGHAPPRPGPTRPQLPPSPAPSAPPFGGIRGRGERPSGDGGGGVARGRARPPIQGHAPGGHAPPRGHAPAPRAGHPPSQAQRGLRAWGRRVLPRRPHPHPAGHAHTQWKPLPPGGRTLWGPAPSLGGSGGHAPSAVATPSPRQSPPLLPSAAFGGEGPVPAPLSPWPRPLLGVGGARPGHAPLLLLLFMVLWAGQRLSPAPSRGGGGRGGGLTTLDLAGKGQGSAPPPSPCPSPYRRPVGAGPIPVKGGRGPSVERRPPIGRRRGGVGAGPL